MTELKKLREEEKKKGIKYEKRIVDAAKSFDTIRKIIKDANINAAEEFNENRKYQ